MKITALILAGGKGERFWPRSRKNCPKQFLSLTGDGRTMIQQTVERIRPLVDPEDIFIATNKSYRDLVREQLPEIPEENVLYEPVGRNTAPGIGLGAVHIRRKYGDAIMLVLPSDHQIKYKGMFLNVLKDGIRVAEEGTNLVTLGITPVAPETGYGYIKFNPESTKEDAFKVDRFVEKPDVNKAKEYLESEEYLWNSGMFVWKASTILASMERHLPEIYSGLTRIESAIGTEDEDSILRGVFESLPSESIDYGVLEKEKNIYVLPGTFGWDDVGSWLSVERMRPLNESGNTVAGNVLTVNVKDCIIEGEKKLIAAVGIRDLVVVDTEDAILICAKDSTTDIRKIVENLKICNRDEYL
ncbi:MAG: NTP transferase domain-containing protein [Lachnospiraceae bacterium]|nr:NTP transferase domain-containing protein [Lachnospiraceae bacterium]